MIDAAELVLAAKTRLGTWDAVADALPLQSNGSTKATWWKIANHQQTANVAQENALRAFHGLPMLPPPPAEIVAASGVQHVVVMSDSPDAALLVNVRGKAPRSITIRLSEDAIDEAASTPEAVVTTVTSPRARASRGGLTVRRDVWQRAKQAKERHGLTWDALVALAVDMLDEDVPYIKERGEVSE